MRFMVLSYRVFQPRLIHHLMLAGAHQGGLVILANEKLQIFKVSPKHMNHGPAFQALWKRLRAQVRQLQDRGYYGDGILLLDAFLLSPNLIGVFFKVIGPQALDSQIRLELQGMAFRRENSQNTWHYYLFFVHTWWFIDMNAQCGGAQSRTRPTVTRRRRTTLGKRRRETVPSLHTGRQTAIKRKAGARVTSKYAFTGQGSMLDNDGAGKGFGKQAARYVRGNRENFELHDAISDIRSNSKRAREERALATERRLCALQGAQGTNLSSDFGLSSSCFLNRACPIQSTDF